MGLSKLYLPEKLVASMVFISHRRSVNNFTTKRPEYEEYELASPEFGQVQVRVPVDKQRLGLKAMTPVKLTGVYLVPSTKVRNIGGKNTAIEYSCFAENIEVSGGVK